MQSSISFSYKTLCQESNGNRFPKYYHLQSKPRPKKIIWQWIIKSSKLCWKYFSESKLVIANSVLWLLSTENEFFEVVIWFSETEKSRPVPYQVNRRVLLLYLLDILPEFRLNTKFKNFLSTNLTFTTHLLLQTPHNSQIILLIYRLSFRICVYTNLHLRTSKTTVNCQQSEHSTHPVIHMRREHSWHCQSI